MTPEPAKRAESSTRMRFVDLIGQISHSFFRTDLMVFTPHQLFAVRHCPKIDVGFGPVREAPQNASLPNDARDWLVDVVKPVLHRLLNRDIASGHLRQLDLADQDVVPHLIVSAERGRTDVVIRAEAIQVCVSQELRILDL